MKEVIGSATLYLGDVRDVLKELPDESVHCCVTSPPYWGLRDYGFDGQIGLEPTIEEYVEKILSVFQEVKRVLSDDATLWLNIGDCYHSGDRGGWRGDAHRWEKSELQQGNRGNAATVRPNRLPQAGLKDKDLVGVPWRVAFALQADGWYLRSDIIWHKPNPMPESVTDRPTKSHEYIFLLSKSQRYYYDHEAVKEPTLPESISRYDRGRSETHKWADGGPGNQTTARSFGHMRVHGNKPGRDDGGMACNDRTGRYRNKRSVWTVSTTSFPGAHFATFPPKLIEPCILAGCPEGGIVLDTFSGSGTTAVVAHNLGRKSIMIDGQPEYYAMGKKRIQGAQMQQRLF